MSGHPTPRQMDYLNHGRAGAGGKLPLFDSYGQEYGVETIRACIRHGWAEPWFENPIKPEWLICRITQSGLDAVATAKAEISEET